MHRLALLLVLTALTLTPQLAAAQKITKETLDTEAGPRTYYLFVPERASDSPAPLVVLLHGSNRDGRIMVDHWQELAKKEGLILAGPDSRQKIEWHMDPDGPHFLHALVESLKSRFKIDGRRTYLFGHSAGAEHALNMGVLESEYFAAVAVHAGVLNEAYSPFLSRAPRKIPLAIWVGTDDRFYPIPVVRATRDLLSGAGFALELTEINGHTHNYYGRSGQINKEAWAFLQKHQLTAEPKYQPYDMNK